MIVCIAEKPSVARDIADVLGAKDKKDGYIEGNGYQVTWTFGHLCTLKEPHEYTPNWKSWSLGSLPMVPPRFGIKLISNPTYERQFHVIENLMQHADMIINCGDAGQEGELIQRWVMQSRCALSGEASVDFLADGRSHPRRVCQTEGCVRFPAVVRGGAFACHR